MVVPKKSDKLMQHLMVSDKIKAKTYNTSEESEFRALEYDIKNRGTLLPHKMKRYKELWKKCTPEGRKADQEETDKMVKEWEEVLKD